ncbi:hypothetical protein C1Y63_10740 [Corynebacterium sp. 13CS0277]|nr:hypothetical protein C1Y63_10740 [Corynebacterium sp. 13CS0277]
MILLAVAVLLIAWGVWSLTRSDDTPQAAATSQAQPAAQPAAGQQQPAPAAPAAGDADAPQDAAAPAPAPARGAAAPAQDNQAPAAGVPTNAPVVVLNNSTYQGLAADVADRIRGTFAVAEVGNYADGTFPHSVVLYTPGNAVEEATAKTLARSLNITAEPRPADLGEVPAGVLLILTQDMAR